MKLHITQIGRVQIDSYFMIRKSEAFQFLVEQRLDSYELEFRNYEKQKKTNSILEYSTSTHISIGHFH